MVFQKIREKRYIDKTFKRPIEDLELSISSFKGKDALAVSPSPTGNSWQGVLSATEGLFRNRVFQLPQYYSNPVYSNDELGKIGQLLSSNEAEHIVFSGYLPYFDSLIYKLIQSGKRVSVIYHGSHTSVLEDANAADHFERLSGLLRDGVLHKVGLVKKDLYKSFRKLTGQEFYPIHLKTDEDIFSIEPIHFEGLHIGVLTHNNFRKNIYNMISAALLHEHSKVHLKDSYLAGYMAHTDRFILHGSKANRNDFLRIMGGMTINFYVTFSECWGQFVNESLAMGVPCLTSDVSAVLDFDQEMKRRLTVQEFDNDYAIYMKSCEVLENLDYFRTNGPMYIQKVNSIADETLDDFLS